MSARVWLWDAGVFLGFVGVASCALSCGGAARGPSRDDAAAVVLSLSAAVRVVDHACALTAIETESYELAEKCAIHYGAAREALLASALGLDAWDKDRARTACGIIDAVKHVRLLGTGGPEIQAALGAAVAVASPLCKR